MYNVLPSDWNTTLLSGFDLPHLSKEEIQYQCGQCNTMIDWIGRCGYNYDYRKSLGHEYTARQLIAGKFEIKDEWEYQCSISYIHLDQEVANVYRAADIVPPKKSYGRIRY